jgi:hypothetical protein
MLAHPEHRPRHQDVMLLSIEWFERCESARTRFTEHLDHMCALLAQGWLHRQVVAYGRHVSGGPSPKYHPDCDLPSTKRLLS